MYSRRKKSNIKITVFDLYMRLILIMPLTTLFQGKIDSLNKIVFIAIFLLQFYLLLNVPMKRKYIILLMVSLIVYVIGLINTTNLKFDNTIVYYINWIIYSVVIITNKPKFEKWILNRKKYIYLIVEIWTFLVGVSIFLPSCYYIKEGGNRYFGSYCGSIFRLGPTALFIATLAAIMVAVYRDRKAIVFFLVPLYCGLMGSSRTYLVVIGLTFVFGLYFFASNTKQFFAILVPVVCAVLFFYGRSSIAQKISYTKSDDHYGDFWFRITSSRNVIWGSILSAFSKMSFFGKLLGGGYNFSRNLNSGLYAHNDFIEILACHGYVGVVLYVYSMMLLLKQYFKRRPAFILTALVITIWLFNAMFNMFYYYICAALSFPFLLFAMEHYTESKLLTTDLSKQVSNS